MNRTIPAATIFFTNICTEMAFVAAVVAAPTFQRVFGLSETQLGVCLGAPHVGIFFAAFVVGRVTVRRGASFTELIGLCGLIAAASLIAGTTGFYLLLVSLMVQGTAAASLQNGNTTFLSDLYPGQIRRIMALAAALWFGSSVISSPFFGAWLDGMQNAGYEAWAFRSLYLMLVGLFLVCLGLFFAILRKAVVPCPHKQHNAHCRQEIQWGEKRDWCWIPWLALCHGFIVISVMAWVNPMVQKKFAVSDFKSSLVFAAMAFGIAVGRLVIAGRTIDVDDRIMLIMSSLLGGTFFCAGLLAPTYVSTAVLMGLGGFAVCATAPCIFSLIGTRFSSQKATLYGYMEGSIAVAGLAGPALVGVLADHGMAVQHAMLLSPSAALAMAVSCGIWMLREHQVCIRGSER